MPERINPDEPHTYESPLEGLADQARDKIRHARAQIALVRAKLVQTRSYAYDLDLLGQLDLWRRIIVECEDIAKSDASPSHEVRQ